MAHLLDASAVAPGDRVHLQPFLFEKHLHHQDGVAGTLSIRLLEARNLRAAASMFWVRTCNPYVIFRLGKQAARSSTIEGNDNPTWRRELHELKIYKLVDPKRGSSVPPVDDHSDVRLDLIVDVMNEDSLTGRATEVVGMTNGSIIGTASIDLTPLLEGKEEVLDRWISLSGGMPVAAPAAAGGKKGAPKKTEKELMLGEVRVVLQYEPHGMEPVVGDVVKLEGFGAYPSCLVSPLDELELTVKKISGSFLLCTYVTKSGFSAALRLHRNNVFVAHRGSLLDRLYVRCVAEPLEFIGNTPLGQSVREYAKPYVNVARTFSVPALSAARTTIWTTYKASSAAAGAILATMEQ